MSYSGGGSGYPPAGAVPAGGGYPPAGAVPAGGGYPPAGAVPGSGGAPPAGAVPQDGDQATPSAPPMEKMDLIPGYDPGNLGGGDLAPPSYDEATRGTAPPDRTLNTNMPTVDEEGAREVLLQFVSENCCYGKKPAEEMRVLGLETSMAFHYTLKTFSESRSTAWTQEPFTGQPIDGPQNGPAPGPWDMSVRPQQKFKEGKMSVEVPHTASVKPCHVCIGLSRVRCNHCEGLGRTSCSTCNGSGHRTAFRDGNNVQEKCFVCNGDGRKQCMWCNGHGQVKCRTCQGRGQLKCYIKLTVRWKMHQDDHIVERTALGNLITKATGLVAFDEEQPLVWPVNHFPENSINQASNQLVNKHRTTWPAERILLQHHRVRVVPVTKVNYKWKENAEGSYYIYGNERLVHAPDYPQQCCCGCAIL